MEPKIEAKFPLEDDTTIDLKLPDSDPGHPLDTFPTKTQQAAKVLELTQGLDKFTICQGIASKGSSTIGFGTIRAGSQIHSSIPSKANIRRGRAEHDIGEILNVRKLEEKVQILGGLKDADADVKRTSICIGSSYPSFEFVEPKSMPDVKAEKTASKLICRDTSQEAVLDVLDTLRGSASTEGFV